MSQIAIRITRKLFQRIVFVIIVVDGGVRKSIFARKCMFLQIFQEGVKNHKWHLLGYLKWSVSVSQSGTCSTEPRSAIAKETAIGHSAVDHDTLKNQAIGIFKEIWGSRVWAT